MQGKEIRRACFSPVLAVCRCHGEKFSDFCARRGLPKAMSMNMASTFREGPRVPQDLGQLAHQHTAIARVLSGDPSGLADPFPFLYSVSRRAFLRLRLRANACLTRSFWPGFK